MAHSSKLVALFSFGLIAFGGMTALKSNDLGSVKIFTYQMKPIFSPGDRQDEDHKIAEKKANRIIADIKKDITPAPAVTLPKITKITYVKEIVRPERKLEKKQSFFSLETDRLARQNSQPFISSYRVASSSPMNIIPDYSVPKQFVRSYERLVMGKSFAETAMQGTSSYRGAVRKNGPVMLRPTISSTEAVRQISTARLPVSSAKSVRLSQTAMR